MDGLGADALRDELRQMVERLLFEENLVLNAAERRALVRDIQYEMLGFGPIEPLLADPTVSDILVNTHAQVYVERRGRLELTDVRFADDDHLLKIIDKIVSRIGRRVDEASPMVDARLPDGSGIDVCRDVRSVDPSIAGLILTSYDDDAALTAAVAAGAAGYVLKDIHGSDLVSSIRRVAAGETLLDAAMVDRLRTQWGHEQPTDPRLASLWGSPCRK